jgi:RimJ/RimL family protein N-acetyltransferase
LENSSLEIRVESDFLLFSKVPWDTKLFGLDVFSLESWTISTQVSAIDSKAWRTNVLSTVGGQPAILAGRVPAKEVALRVTLGAIGMSIVEWTLHPELDLATYQPKMSTNLKMRIASKDDLTWLLSEAQDAFEVSRFFRDPFVPKDLAAKRFRAWVETSLNDPSKDVFIFENIDHQPIGFFVVSVKGEIANLELTAITSARRGQGWSGPVWETYLVHAKSNGLKRVSTNISAENSAVIGIYPKLGFRFGSSSVAMHGHFPLE